jgi:hypothetical protein
VNRLYCPFDGARLKLSLPGLDGVPTVAAGRPDFQAMLAGTGTVPVTCPSCGRCYEVSRGKA